ncbi:hypothetical protein HanRHA438_Chr08g0372311 [Helianthus annuus]|uniref:Uncharacterized protein n=1 Tax=Helianthus annuus TaxID=4232 RepID=A0A251VD74_HELAN|nr:hypothetical protein HanXRQr2_Chr08g0360321 [Helianthus annuus]KAJ0540382.1 hypothetical protein HanHA300_Chr08g0297631 [Helianthus annuus]KAJ0548898.1 hypothetical protein HanIR_Chr08g0389051 [Helianthus annuus]KAJ0555123.1 hypothetical protein HanHA89_Chr08g0316111 [Helianthus annuus]KAJ0720690.1 hypothetical protein HanLR1_Chr08g0296471 [Helianthus annuus]
MFANLRCSTSPPVLHLYISFTLSDEEEHHCGDWAEIRVVMKVTVGIGVGSPTNLG